MYRLSQRRDTPLPDPARPRVLAVAAIACGLTYLTWRLATLGAGWALTMSVPLYLAETWALAQLSLFAFQAWRVPPPREQDAHWRTLAAVDVVITAAREDERAVERSLVGVDVLDHCGRVTVVDSSERGAIATMARAHGARYVVDQGVGASPAAVVHEQAESDLYLWLEAGQVPMPDLLSGTADAFAEPEVAVCQVAVGLLNGDSLVHVRHGRDEEAVLRDVVGPSLDRLRAAPWFGPASVIRRHAIDSIGGFAPHDTAAVERALIDLHHAGWASRFEPDRLVRQVAPDTLDEYLQQRRRRAIETLRIFRTPENPLRMRGLPLGHRLNHLAAASPFSTGVRQLVMVSVVVATLLTGRLPFDAPAGRLASFWAVATGLQALARHALARGTLGIGDWTRHAWRTVGADLSAIAAVAGHGRGEHATLVSRRHTGLRALCRLRLLTATVLLLDLAILGRAATLFDADLLPPFTTGERVLVLGLGIFALVPMIDVLQVVVFRRQRRRHFRLQTALRVVLGEHAATTVDLAPTGVGLLMEFSPAVGALSPIRVELPAVDGTVRSVSGSAIVRDANPHESGMVRVGLEFVNLADSARKALIEYCMIGHDSQQDGHRSELPVAHAHHLDISREEHHHRLLQGTTGMAVAAGVITLFLGPAAIAAQAGQTDAIERVCVLTVSGEPVAEAVVEQRTGTTWTTVGTTGDEGCVAVARSPKARDLAAVHQGIRREGATPPTGSGLATFALEPHVVRLFDTRGQGVADARVRHYADGWHDAGSTDVSGVRPMQVLATDVDVEVRWQGARFVLPMGPTSTDVVLARVEAGDADVAEIDRGAGFERFVDGMELLPGRVTLRLVDDGVVRVELPAGHLYTVSTRRLTELDVHIPPLATPTPTTPDPTATVAETPVATGTPAATASAAPEPTPAAEPTAEPAPSPTASAEPAPPPTAGPSPEPSATPPPTTEPTSAPTVQAREVPATSMPAEATPDPAPPTSTPTTTPTPTATPAPTEAGR